MFLNSPDSSECQFIMLDNVRVLFIFLTLSVYLKVSCLFSYLTISKTILFPVLSFSEYNKPSVFKVNLILVPSLVFIHTEELNPLNRIASDRFISKTAFSSESSLFISGLIYSTKVLIILSLSDSGSRLYVESPLFDDKSKYLKRCAVNH